MRQARDPRLHAVESETADRLRQEATTQTPDRPSHNAGVPPKAKGQIVVAAGLEQRQRPLQVIARMRVLSGEPVRKSGARCATPASGKSGLSSTSSRKAAACARIAAIRPAGSCRPKAVVCRQSLGRVLVASPTRELSRKLPSFPAPQSRAPQ